MSWTAPRTWVTGELETAAIFNAAVRDNQLVLKNSLIEGATIQIIYYDSLSGKNPVVDSTTYSDWYLCDGGTYNTYATPDFRNKFIVGAGDTYAQGDTGGSTTSAHTHGPGTLNTGVESNTHNHANPNTGGPSLTTGVDNNQDGSLVAVGTETHYHTQGATGTESAQHDHDVDSGVTASASPSIIPPYHAAGYFMYCPA